VVAHDPDSSGDPRSHDSIGEAAGHAQKAAHPTGSREPKLSRPIFAFG
jgi:hypothetical protein